MVKKTILYRLYGTHNFCFVARKINYYTCHNNILEKLHAFEASNSTNKIINQSVGNTHPPWVLETSKRFREYAYTESVDEAVPIMYAAV